MDERTPLTDDALDRALDWLLNERPSAAFEARVRARVAAEEPSGVWHRRWAWAVLPAVGLAAAALLMLILSPLSESRAVPTPPVVAERSPAAPVPVPLVLAVPAPGVAEPRDTSRPTPATAGVARAPGLAAAVAPTAGVLQASVQDFPDVVVSEDEVRTFRRLVALSQRTSQQTEPPPAEITAGNRGTIQWPALAFEAVAIEAPALDNLTLE